MVVAENILELNLKEMSLENVTLPLAQPRYLELETTNEKAQNESFDQIVSWKISLPFSRSEIQKIPIKSARTLSKHENLKEIIEITFDITEMQTDFLPGDTIAILPANRTQDVNFLLEKLELCYKADNLMRISIIPVTAKKGAKIPSYLPSKLSPRQLLTHYLNINTIPKKIFIRNLELYSKDVDEKKFLKTLCSKEGSSLYNKLFLEQSLNFLDILKLCPSCCPPLAIIIENLPRNLPRPYSIANSQNGDNELKICFSILKEKPGLTTNFLKTMTQKLVDKEKSFVNLYMRDANKFRFGYEEANKNVILIGVGCAISPFVGFLEYKATLGACDKQTWLYHGSKCLENSIYKNEFEKFRKIGVLTEYFVAFSQCTEFKWKYVQDAIIENKEKFINFLMDSDTIIYVCADGAKISKSIQNCILNCLIEVNNIELEEGKTLINQFKMGLKYREDVW